MASRQEDLRTATRELLVGETDEKVIAELKKQIWLLDQGIQPPPPWEWLARYCNKTDPMPDPDWNWKVLYNEHGDPISMWCGSWIGETRPPTVPAPALAPPAKCLQFHLPPHPESLGETRRHGVWPGTYQEYTVTEEFRRIAAQAKRDWNYQCLIDVTHRGPVEMHHRTYRGVPFGESWWDLIPLCEDCHRRYHHRLAVPPKGLFDELVEQKAA